MTALPARNVLDGSAAPLTSAMKTAMGQLRDFLSETVGDVGGAVTIAKTAVTSPVAGDGNVFTGTYTPTLANILNTSARTAYLSSYSRSGDMVSGFGSVSITATAIGRCVVTMSLPVASDFTDANARDAGGSVTSKTTSAPLRDGGFVRSNPSANSMELDIYAGSTSATEYSFSFKYRVM